MNLRELQDRCEYELGPEGLGSVTLILHGNHKGERRYLSRAGSPLGRIVGQLEGEDIVLFQAAEVLAWLLNRGNTPPPPPPITHPLGPNPCFLCGAITTRQTRLNDQGQIDLAAPLRPVCDACGPVFTIVGVLDKRQSPTDKE
jgi:hypothetical protein